jgi:hypothetical protein
VEFKDLARRRCTLGRALGVLPLMNEPLPENLVVISSTSEITALTGLRDWLLAALVD